MARRLKQPRTVETSTPDADAILQAKVWLPGVSPMVWRRLLVPGRGAEPTAGDDIETAETDPVRQLIAAGAQSVLSDHADLLD